MDIQVCAKHAQQGLNYHPIMPYHAADTSNFTHEVGSDTVYVAVDAATLAAGGDIDISVKFPCNDSCVTSRK